MVTMAPRARTKPVLNAFAIPKRVPGIIKSLCTSQLPHKFVNQFFILVMIKDKLTNLWGNQLLHSNFINTI